MLVLGLISFFVKLAWKSIAEQEVLQWTVHIKVWGSVCTYVRMYTANAPGMQKLLSMYMHMCMKCDHTSLSA